MAAARVSAPSPDTPAARAAAEDRDALSFEEALERLEGLVDQLEDGELPLEEALAAFEQGVALSRSCTERLEQAERRIEALVAEGGGLAVRPLASDPSGEPD